MRLPRRPAALALALLALLAAAPAAETPAAERYLQHVRFLASPEMRGRGSGMPELERAGEYIADRFRDFGLRPAGDGGTYLQPFQVTTDAVLGDGNALRVRRNRGTAELELERDFVPINFSASGSVEGEVVFAGYGATAEEFGYDDYFHLDVTGKVVLVLRYEPSFFHDRGDGPSNGRSRGRERRYTRHSHLIAKAIQARNRGAAALLVVDARGRRERLIRFGSVSGPTDAGIPMVQVKSDIVEGWLRGSGRSLRVLQRDIDASERPQSFALASSLRVSLEVDVDHQRAVVSNVAGYLPGADESYVVLGAHYDHLGLGSQHSLSPSQVGKVHPGADDNASGVAAILELARGYAGAGERPPVGLLFLAFAAEEIGLLGSSHWTEHPTLPLEHAVAMLNFDMVGRIQDGRLYVGGTGSAEPLASIVERAAASREMKIDTSRSAYSSSDHTSFVAKQIPSLFFFSGLHSDYHKPSDTADKIDAESAVALLGLARDIVGGLASRRGELAFQPDAEESGRRPPSGSGGGSGYGPWFGSVPDFGEVPDGVKFADVRPGSPAAVAGLEGGDVLTHWNGDPVKNLYDFTYALRESEVGEVVRVRFLRDGQERSAEVKLAERP